jgi:riboflavin biosynthesis pyrimidine reductase
MKPHVICLMACSVDGRTLPSRWRPKMASAFERVHDELAGDAWLVGRVTGAEFAKGKPYAAPTSETFPREPWFARRDAKAYGVVMDTQGKIGWGRADIGGDPIVVVLSEAVSDVHLAGLRADGVSYVFAGTSGLDLNLTLEILNRELGVKRLLIEGGGGLNGAFLRAGLIDELYLSDRGWREGRAECVRLHGGGSRRAGTGHGDGAGKRSDPRRRHGAAAIPSSERCHRGGRTVK